MKKTSIFTAVSIAALIAATSPAGAEPIGGAVTAGNATISSAGKTTTITQSTDKAIIEWQSFNIAGNEKVNFVQPTDLSIALNRVLGAGSSAIDGQVSANGRIFIINADGVVFGSGAKIDVNGLLATSTGIADANFMAGIFDFDQPGSPSAAIVNHGAVNAADAGMIAFVAPNVQNSGVLTARLGKIALGAGEAFTLDFFGDRLIAFAASGPSGNKTASLIAGGKIQAEAGTILLAATTARDFIDAVINVESDLAARSANMVGGKIILSGGDQSTININANLDAAGTSGGSISVEGGTIFVNAGAQLLTDAKTGQADGGDIFIHSTTQTNFAGLAISEPGASGGIGGDITIGSDGVLIFTGEARSGTPPRAGVINLNGAVNNSGGGTGGGGTGGGGTSGGGSGGGAGGSGQPPVIVPGPSLKNKSSDRLTEVFGTAAAYARVDLQNADNSAGAEVFMDDAVAFDFANGGQGDDGPGENRLMCLHGVSSAACGDHD